MDKALVTILAEGLRFPEGPAFSADGSIWAVELHGASLVQLRGGRLDRYFVGGRPNGIAIDKHEAIWFCDSGLNAIRCFDPISKKVSQIVEEVGNEKLAQPNDLAFDAAGNLLFTCPGNSRQSPTGYVCVLERTGNVKKIIEGKYFPNGIAFNNAGNKLIIAETYKQRLWSGNWSSDYCRWENEMVLSETGGGVGPDGMAYDENENLYVAVYGSGCIKVVNSEGNICQEISLPGINPTNCAFDPTGKLGLVIAEAEKGCLLSVNLNVKGALLFNR